jgi:hypothetical protein
VFVAAFFDARLPFAHNVRVALDVLARQLAALDAGVRAGLRASMPSADAEGAYALGSLFEALVSGPLLQASERGGLADATEVVLVFDGLDRCTDASDAAALARALVDELAEAARSHNTRARARAAEVRVLALASLEWRGTDGGGERVRVVRLASGDDADDVCAAAQQALHAADAEAQALSMLHVRHLALAAAAPEAMGAALAAHAAHGVHRAMLGCVARAVLSAPQSVRRASAEVVALLAEVDCEGVWDARRLGLWLRRRLGPGGDGSASAWEAVARDARSALSSVLEPAGGDACARLQDSVARALREADARVHGCADVWGALGVDDGGASESGAWHERVLDAARQSSEFCSASPSRLTIIRAGRGVTVASAARANRCSRVAARRSAAAARACAASRSSR